MRFKNHLALLSLNLIALVLIIQTVILSPLTEKLYKVDQSYNNIFSGINFLKGVSENHLVIPFIVSIGLIFYSTIHILINIKKELK